MTWRGRAVRFAGLLVLWEIVGRPRLVADGALPAPSDILVQFWADRADYAGHAAATLQGASVGFVAGNLVAVLAALAFVRWPVTERLAQGVNVALFALPPIALVPILILTFEGMVPRYVLAAIAVYFPTMTAMMVGLTQIDPRAVDVVRAYGGGDGALLRLVRLRSSLPALMAGLQVGAPNAVLGSILAEFGGGGRWGLGVYLIGSLGQANPARLWGIGLAATAIAGALYLAFALLARRLTGSTRAVTLAAGAAPRPARSAGWTRLAAFLLPFALWWLLLVALDVPPLVGKTPAGVIDYLFFARSAEAAQAKLLAALVETIPITLVGMAAGLAFALAFATLGEVRPAAAEALLPIALVSQTMPLVALTPLLVLLLGRDAAVTVVITVSVTFFPAYVAVAQGLRMTSRAALDLCDAYGADPLHKLALVSLPGAVPYLLAAAKLAVPRALLGVLIAEWLATGRGLGGLMNQSRGFLDYGMIWSVALVSVLISVLLYRAVGILETLWERRLS
jgi:ABC-type nitrate/sulfonate/bicarbonate transport system permease component